MDAEVLGGHGRRLQAVDVLGLRERREAVLLLPEALAAERRERELLALLHRAARDAGHALELAEQRVHLLAVRAARERERAQVERRVAGVVELARRELGVVARLEVDERDRDARLLLVGDEQELVARRRRLLDDHLGERRQQVALDRALERTGAEVGREALRDDELGRGLVQLDRPGPRAQAAPREHLAQLLLQQLAHLLELERAEHDHAVDAVQELRPERPGAPRPRRARDGRGPARDRSRPACPSRSTSRCSR